MSELETRLDECFKAVFTDLTDDDVRRASTASVGAWDSVASLSLMAVIEEQFGVPIPTELMGDLVSYDLVLEYIKEREA